MHKFIILGKKFASEVKQTKTGKTIYTLSIVSPDQSKFKGTLFAGDYTQKHVDTFDSGVMCIVEGRLREGQKKEGYGVGFTELAIDSIKPLYPAKKGGEMSGAETVAKLDQATVSSVEETQQFDDDEIPF